jgi:nuclear pore complex protein Nup107
LEEALELCSKANQPWRAASIRGALLFNWPTIGKICFKIPLPKTKDIVADQHQIEADEPEVDQWSGNRRRTLWKEMCTLAALNVRLFTPFLHLFLTHSNSLLLLNLSAYFMRHWHHHLRHLLSCAQRAEHGSITYGRR